MPQHLSFRDDAIAELLAAFESYRRLNERGNSNVTIRECAMLLRSLHIGIEKAFKAGLASIDPHLVIDSPRIEVLLDTHRDLASNPAPSIFASRNWFKTTDLLESWKRLRDVTSNEEVPQRVAGFEQAAKLLVQKRNRAQHGELYDDVSDLMEIVAQVFAHLPFALAVRNGELLEELYKRNTYMEPQLRGIREQLDGNWLTILKLLTSVDHIACATSLTTISEAPEAPLALEMGSTFPIGQNGLRFASTIDREQATGVFAAFSSATEVEDRRLRHAIANQLIQITETPKDQVLSFIGGSATRRKPLLTVHEPSRLSLSNQPAIVSVRTGSVLGDVITASCMINKLIATFPGDGGSMGTIEGTLSASDPVTAATQSSLALSGTIAFSKERGYDAEIDWLRLGRRGAWREFETQFRLSTDVQGGMVKPQDD